MNASTRHAAGRQAIRIFSVFGHACIALIALLFVAIASAQSAAPPAAGAPDPLADRMHRLTQDLRCLVCQNESLADSHAPLALDLKREIRALMAQGQSDAQIRDFLTRRYGDFVNYQPPLRASTLLLWAGPLLMLGAGGWLVWRSVRAGQHARRAAGKHGSDGGMGMSSASGLTQGQGDDKSCASDGGGAGDGGGGDGGGGGGD